jgi:predicted transcriptional regulator
VFSVWIGYKRMWGDAASTLLEQGLHDMTVRDVEIVGQIIDLKEFTIPELIRQTGASKITVWRTVQKLIEQGLVKQIEQTKPAANGLGGRGKPSRVYKYLGAPSPKT